MSKTSAKMENTQSVSVPSTIDDFKMKVFGLENLSMANALLRHCSIVLNSNEANREGWKDNEFQFMIAAVEGIKPRDTIERMLAVQMSATHMALIRVGGLFARADLLHQSEAHERAYNKLARTFTAQMEALRKHRNGGRQTVTVQHVNVEDGGQAIVGNVQAGGRDKDEK